MKYVDDLRKPSPYMYRQFCCPVSLISASSSANIPDIPVSPQFLGQFDVLTLTAHHFQNHSFPVLFIPNSTQPARKPPKAA